MSLALSSKMKMKSGGEKFVINIFVEGTGDIKFIKDFIQIHFNLFPNDGIIYFNTGGKDEIRKSAQKFESDEANLIIFDADYPRNNGGFQPRNAELTNLKNELEIDFELFLFPNNQDDGDLETLLENVINPTNQVIFDCWNEYEQCLHTKQNVHRQDRNFTIPAKKSKIYTYLESLLLDTARQKELAKDPKRDYTNTEHWDIANTANPYVLELYNFLNRYLQ